MGSGNQAFRPKDFLHEATTLIRAAKFWKRYRGAKNGRPGLMSDKLWLVEASDKLKFVGQLFSFMIKCACFARAPIA
jgi:hypothetical protein